MLVCESSDCRMDYLSSPRKHRKAESEQSDNLIPRAQIVKLEPQRQIARLVEGTWPCSMYRTIRKILCSLECSVLYSTCYLGAINLYEGQIQQEEGVIEFMPPLDDELSAI